MGDPLTQALFCQSEVGVERGIRCLSKVFQKQQVKMLHALKALPSKANFFELSRFDFVVDEDLNVFLMEANMSPNLSSGHFAQNQILYEQVLFNIFSLVGIASAFTKDIREQSQEYNNARKFLAPDQSIYSFAHECSRCSPCDAMMECQLCASCMAPATLSFLRATSIEHSSKQDMKMLNFDEKQKPLTKEDHLLRLWRRVKCKHEQSWC
ncbi:unnamed protein product [Cylicocyclus nassatus]|uniref:Uncharacterized protein n=1 Tax=Cylicocyclus nassatus TaxID=53992 RepID=A0AA36DNX4_CYLNA|nr:unnamed protein product [Cylicocyclus nassatus]